MSATISSPVFFTAAVVAALILIASLLLARLPLLAKVLFGSAAMLLACAAGGFSVTWPRLPNVVVMVDVSPSTRSASYRDPTALAARVEQLLPSIAHRTLFFAREETSEVDRSLQTQRLDDVAVDETQFSPPAVDAVVLLSDGQFALPADSPPVFAVVDSGIENAGDASIQSIEIRDRKAVTHVNNRGGDRVLSWDGAAQSDVARGSYAIERALPENDNSAAASFNGDDAWPENDSGIAMRAPRPAERAWIGSSAPNGWRTHAAEEVVRDPSLLLSSSIITVAVPADQVSQRAQESLVAYVRDLGGTLILRGGPNGFAAGGYTGTPIDAISPLASSPPEPARQWILVVDASGSMAAAVDGSTRFERATSAMKSLLDNLPPQDIVQIGSIAEQFTPWSAPQPVERSKDVAPPTDLTPRGPTNLEPFLTSLTRDTNSLPREVVIITDGEAELSNVARLAEALRGANVQPSVLLIGDSTRGSALQELATAAGGQLRGERDARNWSTSLRALARGAIGETMVTANARVAFENLIDSNVSINLLNRTWPRDAKLLAQVDHGGQRWPVAAEWRVGGGRVLALAFEADGGLIDQLAQIFAAPPADPRFSVSVQMRKEVEVELLARDQARPMNQLRCSLRSIASGSEIQFNQVSPGTYRATLPRANAPRAFDVVVDGRIIDRIALPPVRAREFDEVGLNRANLNALVERFGGVVIEADDVSPISLPGKMTTKSIDRECAAAAAIIALAAIVWMRLRSQTQ